LKKLAAGFAALVSLAAAPMPKSPDEVLAAAPATDWHRMDPADLLVMTLPTGTVVIALAPDFAPRTIANIKTLVHGGYFNTGAAITRSQDNYVVQWSRDPEPPPGKGWIEFERATRPSFRPLKDRDTYAPQAGFDQGFAAAGDGKQEWLVHCYATVGVGRDMAADTGTGAELYAVTGQAPRHLDRNITVVGRVVQGMALLSSLPRGPAPMGFYARRGERMNIRSIRLASDLPPAEQPKLEALDTASHSFDAYVEARRNRGGPFFVRPAGHIDVCNVPLPVRPATH
jgi:peptidylprolyl isomerase